MAMSIYAPQIYQCWDKKYDADNITGTQLVDIFNKYLADNPDKRQYDGDNLVIIALFSTYPLANCQ